MNYLSKIIEFIESKNKAKHLSYDTMTVYVRKSKRLSPFNRNTLVDFIDVATVSVEEEHQNKGCFTEFITDLESLDVPIFIENILNEHLLESLLKRGYVRHPSYEWDECLYTNISNIEKKPSIGI